MAFHYGDIDGCFSGFVASGDVRAFLQTRLNGGEVIFVCGGKELLRCDRWVLGLCDTGTEGRNNQHSKRKECYCAPP